MAGRVWIVGAGPGDPKLLTIRAREVLDAADVILYDRLVNEEVVAGKRAICVGKRPGNHLLSQQEINGLLVKLARNGHDVARLKGGDPFVFGRGAEEAEALAAHGIPFEVVPGPSSAIAAAAYAGIPVTHRECSSSVAFVTGHGRKPDWGKLATAVDTIVVLMGLATMTEVVDGLISGGLATTTPAALVQDGTLPTQRVVVTDLQGLVGAGAEVRSPAIAVIGEVVRLRERIAWYVEDVVQLQAVPEHGFS